MSRDTTVIPFRQREAIDDPLSELAREGARRMLAQALIAEADSLAALLGKDAPRIGHDVHDTAANSRGATHDRTSGEGV
jgi:hypothetical protein